MLLVCDGGIELRTPVGGDSYTINVGRLSLRANAPFNTRHAASMRAIYDLADPRAGAWMLGTGESGHPLSDQYATMIDDWRHVSYASIRWDAPASSGPSTKMLVLRPQTRTGSRPVP
jgi:penicillin G amidase